MFLTFEGIEGSGKSTQARLLVERLQAAGYRVRLTREPGGTPLAGAIRALLLHPEASLRALAAAGLAPGSEPAEPMLPLTELLLLSAARAQHVARIRAWLADGEIVICDRYADATRAYQGAGRGLDETSITTLERLATGGLRPNLTLLLDLPVEEGLRRRALARDASQAHATGTAAAASGEWNRFDAEEHAFHERVRAGYLALATAEPARWRILDATLPPDALAEHVWEVTSPLLQATDTPPQPST